MFWKYAAVDFTGEHPCRRVISRKLQNNFIEITLRHGRSPVNLMYIFRTPFLKNTSAGLLPLLISVLLLLFWFFRSSRPEVYCKKVFLKISQNSQENTCTKVFFSIKLQAWDLQLYQKRDSDTECFPVNFVNFLRTSYGCFWFLLID